MFMKIINLLKRAIKAYCENAAKSGMYRVTGDATLLPRNFNI